MVLWTWHSVGLIHYLIHYDPRRITQNGANNRGLVGISKGRSIARPITRSIARPDNQGSMQAAPIAACIWTVLAEQRSDNQADDCHDVDQNVH